MSRNVCGHGTTKPSPSCGSEVRTGKLENGLTYYIRHNGQPENRADFYIAQKVGSMQEEDNQAGLAHFLDHMAFNCTYNYPGKAMLNYLQDNGIKFGTNINAYTSFDETVYYISDIPTNNQNLVDSALLVLHDWSNAIALEEEELENERGSARNGAPVVVHTTAVDQLLPKCIRQQVCQPNAYRQHRRDQQLQAGRDPRLLSQVVSSRSSGIIVVGDFDLDEMEQKVKALFSPIKLEEESGKGLLPVPTTRNPGGFATDKEARSTQLMLFYKHDPLPEELKNTQMGYITTYLLNAASP